MDNNPSSNVCRLIVFAYAVIMDSVLFVAFARVGTLMRVCTMGRVDGELQRPFATKFTSCVEGGSASREINLR